MLLDKFNSQLQLLLIKPFIIIPTTHEFFENVKIQYLDIVSNKMELDFKEKNINTWQC